MDSKKSSGAIRLVREQLVDDPNSEATEATAQATFLPRLPEMPPSPSDSHRELLAKFQNGEAAVQARMSETTTREALTLTASWHLFQAMLGVMLSISLVLAARFLLLLAVLAAALLAWQAMKEPTLMTLSMTAAFDIGVVAPIVWLYLKRG